MDSTDGFAGFTSEPSAVDAGSLPAESAEGFTLRMAITETSNKGQMEK